MSTNIDLLKGIRTEWDKKQFKKDIPYESVSRYRIKTLKNLFQGKKVIIFTCGPSIKKITKTQIQQFIDKGYIIVCVKQAIEYMPNNFTHFHVLNFCNEKKYVYNTDFVPIRIYCQEDKFIKPKKHCDIVVSHIPHNLEDNIITNMIAGKDEMSFEKLLTRKPLQVKWGDTMYELAIPLSLYVGCNDIYVVGWDCKNFTDRFYKGNKVKHRSAKRKKLDKLQLIASCNIQSFLKKKFNATIQLVGIPSDTALQISTITVESIIY